MLLSGSFRWKRQRRGTSIPMPPRCAWVGVPRGRRTRDKSLVSGLGHQHRPRLDSGTRRDPCARVPSWVTDLHGLAWLLHGLCSLRLGSSVPGSPSPFYRSPLCSPGWPRTQTSPCLCFWSPGSLVALLPGLVLSAAGPPQGHVRRRSAPVGSAGRAADTRSFVRSVASLGSVPRFRAQRG